MNYDRDAAGDKVKGIGYAQPGGNEDHKESKVKRVSAEFINPFGLKMFYAPVW